MTLKSEELKDAFKSCMKVADKYNNDGLRQLCLATLFNDDYFWT